MIAIVDYGLGNVKAFANIFAELNLAHVIALQDRKDVLGPGGRLFVCGLGAGVHVLFRLPRVGRDCRQSRALHQSAKTHMALRKRPRFLRSQDNAHESGCAGWDVLLR